MGLNLLPCQFIHQTKGNALQNKKIHVNKPLPVNLATSQNDPLHDLLSVFFQRKGGPTGAQRPSGHLFAVLHASVSHLINYLWVTTSNRCKILRFFSFFSTFGGWEGNHFLQNFTENNSIRNFKAWKPREIAEKCLVWRAPKFSSILVKIDRIGRVNMAFLAIWGQYWTLKYKLAR